jgi:hypothetical protein
LQPQHGWPVGKVSERLQTGVNDQHQDDGNQQIEGGDRRKVADQPLHRRAVRRQQQPDGDNQGADAGAVDQRKDHQPAQQGDLHAPVRLSPHCG